MSTQTPGTPTPQGPKAPPLADKPKAEAQGAAQHQAAQGDHAKKPETDVSKDNKSGKPS